MVKISSKSDEKSIFGEFFKIFEKILTIRGRHRHRKTVPLISLAFPENLVAIRSTIDFWQKFQKVVHLASHRGRHCRRRPLGSHGSTCHIHLNNHRKFHQIISNRSRLIETDILLQVQSFSGFELKTSYTEFFIKSCDRRAIFVLGGLIAHPAGHNWAKRQPLRGTRSGDTVCQTWLIRRFGRSAPGVKVHKNHVS